LQLLFEPVLNMQLLKEKKKTYVGQYGQVSIAKCCRMIGSGIENLWGRIFPHFCRSALGHTIII